MKLSDEQKRLTKLWRRCGWGRLYWRSRNRRWHRAFDSDDVAIVIDGPARMHIKGRGALAELLIEMNCGEK